VHAVLRREGSDWVPVVGTPIGAEISTRPGSW
jgi:hypothetical protein